MTIKLKIAIMALSMNVFAFSQNFSNLSLEEKFDHFVSLGVPSVPLEETFNYYDSNVDLFANKKYVSIIDYSQNSKNKRFYIMDMETGELEREYVAHGSGRNRIGFPVADINHNGMLDRCMHSKFSRRIRLVKHRRWGMTRPGFIRVDGTYHSSKFAYGEYKKTKAHNAILLNGLEASSSDVRRNAVVIHEASYVYDKAVRQGRTLGCPAVAKGVIKRFINKLKGGSLLYSYVPQCK